MKFSGPASSRSGGRTMRIPCTFHVPALVGSGRGPSGDARPSPGLHLSPAAVYGKAWRGRGEAMAFFQKLKERLFKSSSKIEEGIDAIIESAPRPAAPAPAPAPRRRLRPRRSGRGLVGRLFGQEKGRVLDDAMLESLEELLIASDMGVETSLKVTAAIAEGRFGRRVGSREIRELLAAEIAAILEPVAKADADLPEAPAGGARRRGQRLGQDHDDRQAREPVPRGGQDGGDRGGRHLPRRGGRAAADLGRAGRRAGDDGGRRGRTRRASPSTRWRGPRRRGRTSSSSTPPGGCRTART